MRFTTEEIALCKKIAEKYKKNNELGDWYLLEGNPILVAWSNRGFQRAKENKEVIIPLWQISDCLDWLDERCGDWELGKDRDEHGKPTGKIGFFWMPPIDKHKDNYTLGNTPLEALLKAVLAIVEEK